MEGYNIQIWLLIREFVHLSTYQESFYQFYVKI